MFPMFLTITSIDYLQTDIRTKLLIFLRSLKGLDLGADSLLVCFKNKDIQDYILAKYVIAAKMAFLDAKKDSCL